MPNQIINKACREATALETMGMDYRTAIRVAAGSSDCEAAEIARELQRRSAEKRALNRKKRQLVDAYWDRMSRYEN